MKFTKTEDEIKIMKKSGEICAQALKKVLKNVKSGVSCDNLDRVAEGEIKKRNASPSFMTVDNYKWTICTTINDQVVHGIPTSRQLADDDVLGIDIGAIFKGFHSDMAITVGVGSISQEKKHFIATGQNTLEKAIRYAQVGGRIGDISQTIQEEIENAGFSIVTSLTGHGIGRKLHEEPLIPGVGKKGTGPKILENMVLAIEVIYAQGSGNVVIEKDGWTIKTVDGSLGGLFEKTVAVTKSGPIVLTPYL